MIKIFAKDPLKKALFFLVRQVKAGIEKRFLEANIALTPLQYGVLSHIQLDSMTLIGLSREFNMKSPSLVPVVDALEKQGYLIREAHTDDRRKTNLIITKKGTELLTQFPLNDKDDALNLAFKKLSFDKQKQLLSLLQELTDNLPQ